MGEQPKSLKVKINNAFEKFVENLGKQIFIGSATVYLVNKGNLSTWEDVKAVLIAGAVAGVTWALAKATASKV